MCPMERAHFLKEVIDPQYQSGRGVRIDTCVARIQGPLYLCGKPIDFLNAHDRHNNVRKIIQPAWYRTI